MILAELLADLARSGVKLWVDGDKLRVRAPQGVLQPAMRATLAERKAEVLAFLQKAERDSQTTLPLMADPGRTEHALSFAQEELWFAEQIAAGGSAFTVASAIRLIGQLDLPTLRACIAAIVRRQAALRTTFAVVDGQATQIVRPTVELPLAQVDLSDLGPADQQAQLLRIGAEAAQQPFDLQRGPLLRLTLCRLSAAEHVLHLAAHHIVFDAWSIGVFMRELAAHYATSQPPQSAAGAPPELPIQFGDFADWQRRWLRDASVEPQLSYWKRQLADTPARLELPTDRPRPQTQSFRRERRSFQLGPALSAALTQLSRDEGVTLFTTLLAAFAALLYRYSGQQDILIGAPTSGRSRPETHDLIASFAYPLVLRSQLSDDLRFRALLAQVRDTVLEAYAHQDVPFAKVVEIAQPQRSTQHSPLFQVMFSFPRPMAPIDAPGLTLSVLEDLLEVSSNYDLVLGISEHPNELGGLFAYNPDLFDSTTIERLLEHFQVLLQGIVADAGQPVARLPLLTASERERLLAAAAPSEPSPAAPRVDQLVTAQAQHSPDTTALVCGAQQLSYGQLEQRVRQCARQLRQLGVGARPHDDPPVALCIEPSIDLVVGLLGILKAGGAVLPLDPAWPQRWRAGVIAEARARVLLTHTQLAATLTEDGLTVVCLDTPPAADAGPFADETGADQLAYVVYSAGRGVPVAHRALSRRLQLLQDSFALQPGESMLHSADPGLDASLWEICWPLSVGARLVLATAEERRDPARLAERIAAERIALAHLTPRRLADYVAAPPAAHQPRLILCSGAPLPASLIERCHELRADLHWLYAPPEAAAHVAVRRCQPGQSPAAGARPTGQPLAVLDRSRQLTPIGVYGEVSIGGDLARPYLHAPQASAQRFGPDPLNPQRQLFRTGDRGRWLQDGTLVLNGATLRQVWIDGYRVEPGEIEAALLQDSAFKACVVLAREARSGAHELIAYVVPVGSFSAEQTHARLAATLPPHLLPHAWVPLTALPLTSAGEIDVAALLRLPVIDADLLARWESTARGLLGIEELAVVAQAKATRPTLLHLADVLPPRAGAATRASAASTPSATEAAGAAEPRWSIAEGAPLIVPADMPQTLPETLRRAAERTPQHGLIYLLRDGSEQRQSYAELLDDAQRILTGLRALGLQPHDPVLFQFDQNRDFLAAFWACLLAGCVPVPLAIPTTYESSNAGVNRLYHAWQMLDRPVILTSAALAPAIQGLAASFETPTLRVGQIEALRQHPPSSDWHASQPDDLTLMMLTSGSTGAPKAVMLCHRNLLSRSLASVQMNSFSSADVSLNWMPLDHVAGIIYFHLRDVFTGCLQVQVPTGAVLEDPLRWLDWIERFHVTVTFAPNFAFGLVNNLAAEIGRRRWDLSSMRSILNGAEAIVAKTARRFLELLLPHGLRPTVMVPAWGMSETSSGVVYSDRFALETTSDADPFVEVGAPLPGFAMRIVDGRDQPVSEGSVGRLQVKGPTVTSGYYRRPELNQEVFTGDGWFNTGDLGYIRDGRLTISGREKDVIVINSVNYYSHEIESVVESIDGVAPSFTAACAVRTPAHDTDQLAVFFHAPGVNGNLPALLKEIRRRVVQQLGINPEYLIPIEQEAIPKTSIGKIQRSQLSERFASGEFDAILKAIDLQTGAANTLPNWFFRTVWRPRQSQPRTTQLGPQRVLLFADELGLADAVAAQLVADGQRCVQVVAGAGFARSDADRFVIDPADPDGYRQLLAALAADPFQPSTIVHLWTYDSRSADEISDATLEQSQQRGAQSVLSLAQALAAHGALPVRLLVVSSNAQPVAAAEAVDYTKAPLLGLLTTLPQEVSSLSCRHIDLPDGSAETHAALLLCELAALDDEREVAYRDGRRWVPRLEQIDLTQTARQALPFRPGGRYLISGGLGDLGVEVARYLLSEYQANLLILGRTALTEHDAPSTAEARRLTTYRALEQLPGSVRYGAVDVCDVSEVRQAVAEATDVWGGELDGVIHLAGVFTERLLLDETGESLLAALRAKLIGTVVLDRLLRDRPDACFLSFSSVNSFFGGVGAGAYAAANRVLDHFTHTRRAQGAQNYTCFAWSMWHELGVSHGYRMKELSAARGYYALEPRQAINALQIALHHRQPQLLIGLDEANPAIQHHLTTGGGSHELCAYVGGTSGSAGSSLSATVLDRFGTPAPCALVQMPELPRTADGAIDRVQLLAAPGKARSAERIAPRTDIERTIAAIWQDVLKVGNIGVDDNFFDLGGHSILVVQTYSRLRDVFQRELSMVELFKYPTISALAEYLSQEQPDPPPTQEVEQRVSTRKALQERQRQQRQRATRQEEATHE